LTAKTPQGGLGMSSSTSVLCCRDYALKLQIVPIDFSEIQKLKAPYRPMGKTIRAIFKIIFLFGRPLLDYASRKERWNLLRVGFSSAFQG
jgi:hypothetical protein